MSHGNNPQLFLVMFHLVTKLFLGLLPFRRGHLFRKCSAAHFHWCTVRGSLLTNIFNQTDMNTTFGPLPKCKKKKVNQ